MRIGSLFSGAGGLDMAVEHVFGGTVVWHSEIDKAASKLLAYRYPDIPNLGDISAIDWSDVPAIDILCGGFPCQDVSLAASYRRQGMRPDNRSGLWSHMATAIQETNPKEASPSVAVAASVDVSDCPGAVQVQALVSRTFTGIAEAMADQWGDTNMGIQEELWPA